MATNNGKKLIAAKLYISAEEMLSDLSAHFALLDRAFSIEPFSIIRDNLPIIEQDGEKFASLTTDENGLPAFDPEATPKLGSLAIVPIYGETATQHEGESVAVPDALYILNMPKVSEVISSDRLANYRRDLIARDMLSRARAIATRNHADATAAPLIHDRVSALLAVAGRNTQSKIERSFVALFPIIQGALRQNIEAKVAALKAAGNHSMARAVDATFSKARLNRDTLKACLSSAEAAKLDFPAMPQSAWVNLLNFAIAYSPRFKARKRVVDASGNPVKDAEGKLTYEMVPTELNPTIFRQWLATRDETGAAASAVQIDLSDMGFSAAEPAAATTT